MKLLSVKLLAAAGLTALTVLGGCAEFRENTSAAIVESVTGTSLGPKPANTADFVRNSRPERTGFMAVGVTPPKRELPPKTAAEVAATEAQMLGAAQQQQAAGVAVEAEGARVIQTAPKAPVVE